MKKLAFAFAAVILSCMVTCTNNAAHEDGSSEKAHKNIANVKAVISMFETGDYTKAGDYISANGVDHTPPMGGEVKGLDSLKALFAKMSGTMSNVKHEFKKEFSDDEYSMVWVRQTWTQTKDDPMIGMKAGQNGDIQTVEVCKHGADGKITDRWGFMYIPDMMKMMPKPGDSTGKK